MKPWYTSKPVYQTERSHLNYAVSDSGWEGTTAYMIDHDDLVAGWVKNDHLMFEIAYVYRGGVHLYRPDYLIKLKNGTTLVLEVKGQDDARNKAKRSALAQWVNAVNADGRFDTWTWDVIFEPRDIVPVLQKHGMLTRQAERSERGDMEKIATSMLMRVDAFKQQIIDDSWPIERVMEFLSIDANTVSKLVSEGKLLSIAFQGRDFFQSGSLTTPGLTNFFHILPGY